ncbi:MAG TPA: malto-oligosyltrehalose trehalohydrolase [Acidobacteriaceae bacterium]|nr:malto-oligosyltrehalose trehalohydrolase [Acidobacteriaceae bacterium]
MHEFEVWAPRVKQLRVKVGDAVHAMQGPDDRGWWRVRVEEACPGMDYGFLLDDDPKLYPDPRSLWQPGRVHAPSRIYDQSAFAWSDQGWQGPSLAGSVHYELHLGTFTPGGTLDSAIEKLDYLAELGITHIELMPVAEFAGDRGWGYDGVDLFAVSEDYGGPDALKRFVNACHGRGLAVMLDVVYNHFGPVGNYTGKFGPYTTNRHCTPWGDAINFEGPGSDQVRRFFCDNALMWMRDFHVDGLRLDAVHEIVDRSALHFLEQLAAETAVLSATLDRRLILVAESDLNDPRIVRPREAWGYGIDAQWSDDFHHALFTVLHSEPGGYYADFGTVELLAKAMREVFVYDGCYSQYRNRSHGRPMEGLSAQRFLCFLQNHDQVGNRAQGERIEHLVGMERAKVAAGLVLTAPYVPLLFAGEEFAASTPFLYFADHEEPEMARAVSEGRKREFAAFGFAEKDVPDPEVRETFERSRLNWEEVEQDRHREMLAWYRALIQLRRRSPAFNDGDLGHLRVRFDEKARWIEVERPGLGQGCVRVLANLGGDEASFEVDPSMRVELASRAGIGIESGRVVLPPDSLTILSNRTV